MTATKDSLQSWVLEGLVAHGGRARLIEVAKHIWEHHEADLRAAGDLFYSWQYDIRWAEKTASGFGYGFSSWYLGGETVGDWLIS
jgi:hypothetical protein